MIHFSSGEMLRQEVAKKTDLGRLVEQDLRRGALVPDETIIPAMRLILSQLLGKPGSESQILLLDGFPRNEAQALALDGILGSEATTTKGKVDLVINLVLRRDLLLGKLTARRVCPTHGCGESYNIASFIEPENNVNLPPLLPKVSYPSLCLSLSPPTPPFLCFDLGGRTLRCLWCCVATAP